MRGSLATAAFFSNTSTGIFALHATVGCVSAVSPPPTLQLPRAIGDARLLQSAVVVRNDITRAFAPRRLTLAPGPLLESCIVLLVNAGLPPPRRHLFLPGPATSRSNGTPRAPSPSCFFLVVATAACCPRAAAVASASPRLLPMTRFLPSSALPTRAIATGYRIRHPCGSIVFTPPCRWL